MTNNPNNITHADHLTDYDKENLQIYTVIFDANQEGTPAEEIAKSIWGGDFQAQAAEHIDSHLKRFRWIQTDGLFLLLNAED